MTRHTKLWFALYCVLFLAILGLIGLVASAVHGQGVYIAPTVPGLPTIPALGQRGFVVDSNTIRPTTPGLPYPSLTEPGYVIAPDSPRPHLIPVFPCSPPADADDDQ